VPQVTLHQTVEKNKTLSFAEWQTCTLQQKADYGGRAAKINNKISQKKGSGYEQNSPEKL